MSVMLYPCMLCVALLMCLFVLCVAWFPTSTIQLAKYYLIVEVRVNVARSRSLALLLSASFNVLPKSIRCITASSILSFKTKRYYMEEHCRLPLQSGIQQQFGRLGLYSRRCN